jgi:hypothetical protein
MRINPLFGTACITIKHPVPFVPLEQEYPAPKEGFYARTEWRGDRKLMVVESINNQHNKLAEVFEAARLARLLEDKRKGWKA